MDHEPINDRTHDRMTETRQPGRALHRFGARLLVRAMLVLAVACLAGLAPEPDPVPKRWQLLVDAGHLRVATVNVRTYVDGRAVEIPQAFFFMTYKVTNYSGEDLYFAPLWELATDGGELIRSGRGVGSGVTEALLGQLDNGFLESQEAIVGPLLQGEENAKEGLVVWPANDLTIDQIRVYGAGFSGETRTINVFNPESGNHDRRVVLRKTLMLGHVAPGEIVPNSRQPIERREERWIMR